MPSAPHWCTDPFPRMFALMIRNHNCEFIIVLSFNIKSHLCVCVWLLFELKRCWWKLCSPFSWSARVRRTFPTTTLIRSAVGKISGTLAEWGRGISYEIIVAPLAALSGINNETHSDARGKPWERICLTLIQELSLLTSFAKNRLDTQRRDQIFTTFCPNFVIRWRLYCWVKTPDGCQCNSQILHFPSLFIWLGDLGSRCEGRTKRASSHKTSPDTAASCSKGFHNNSCAEV